MRERYVQFQPEVQPQASRNPEPVCIPADAPLREKIIATLRNIYDPEIPVNIYDLGLIYDIDLSDSKHVNINMTLTSPHCPVAESLPSQVQCSIKAIDEVEDVCVTLVWDPPWSQERMSDDARLLLNMY